MPARTRGKLRSRLARDRERRTRTSSVAKEIKLFVKVDSAVKEDDHI